MGGWFHTPHLETLSAKPMHLRIFLFALSLCITCLSHAQQPAAEPHTFTATDGRRLTATIVGKTDTSVTIRRAEDGQEFALPLDRISAADQAFVKAWGEKPAAAATPPVSPPSDAAKQALDDARKFAASGEYAKALERHEWFHENSRGAPGMSGVRLSFALSDWKRLGDKYPPALDSLKKLSDSSSRALLSGAGTFDLFHEVHAINRALLGHGNAGKEETIQLFKQLDESDPALAKKCFHVVKEDLMDTNATELFAKHAGDLKSFLSRQIELHVENGAFFKKRGTDLSYIKSLDEQLNKLTDFMAQIAKSKGDASLADELVAMTAKALAVSQEAPAATPAPAPKVAAPSIPYPPNDEAKQALEDARKFAASGDYAKALERHEWFHANALKISPSMSGVRLSFALGDWKRLGDKYPPALDSLKKLRDEDLKLLRGGRGSQQALLDVWGINRALAKSSNTVPPETIALFKELDATQPDLLTQSFSVIQQDLIQANEGELFVKHAGDLKSYLGQAIEHRADEAKGAKGRSYEAEHIQYLNKRLNELTDFMTQIAKSKGNAALADELRAMSAKALASSPSATPEVKP